MAEGAALPVLEEWELARLAGAPVYEEILGYSLTNGAHHLAAPLPSGAQTAGAMQSALGCPPSQSVATIPRG